MELFISVMVVGVAAVAIVYAMSPLFAWMKAGDALRQVVAMRQDLHQVRTQVVGHDQWLVHLEGRLAAPVAPVEAAPKADASTRQLALPFAPPQPASPPHWENPPAVEAVPDDELAPVDGANGAPEAEAELGPETVAPERHRPDAADVAPPAAADLPATPVTPAPRHVATVDGRAGGWEQWLGVRGAAGLGAALLVLAGLYFFRYSIDHGWLTAPRRIALGLAFAGGCVGAGERWLRARHALLANCVVGAGIALLYLTSWAATDLYALWSPMTAAAVMVATTALCCVLAVTRRSRAIAAFGLVGGFATPALLSTGHDRPLVLFAYLLLLDAGLLVVARTRRWSRVVVFSILGTAVYQTYWIATQMDPSEVGLGMLICGAFATLFAAGTMGRRDDDGTLRQARAAAVLLPFGLTLMTSVSMAPPLPLLGVYLGALVLGGALVAHRDRMPWLGVAVTAAALGSLAARLALPGTLAAEPFAVAAIVVAIGAALHGIAEWGLRRTDPAHPTVAPVVWAAGATLITGVASARLSSLPPLVAPAVAWCLLGASSLRLGHVARRPWAHVVAGVVFGLALAVALPTQIGRASAPLVWAALALVLAAAFGLTRRFRTPHVGHGLAAAGLLPLGAVLHQALVAGTMPLASLSSVLVGATGLAIAAAFRHRAAGWLVATGVIVAWIVAAGTQTVAGPLALLGLTAAALVAAAVHLARRAPALWIAAGALPVIAAPAAIAILDRTVELPLAPLPLAMGPLALAAVAAIAATFAPRDTAGDRGPRTGLAAVTCGLVVTATFLHFSGIALAGVLCLEALALVALWRRVDHAALVWSAGALLALAVARVLEPAVLVETARGPWLVANRFALAYLVPAASLLAAAMAMRPLADPRRRPWEPRTRSGRALLPQLLLAGAIALGFVWVNVVIVDVFATGPTLAFDWIHHPARDLSLSLAWAVYALLLLVGGSRARKLRLTALALLLATSAKVFLYDLSHLDGLYRVLSLGGLAASLLLVSMGYQHLLRRGDAEEAP